MSPTKPTFIPNRTLALLNCKCPQCQTGDMFITGSTNLKGFTKMYDNCQVCGLKYEIEPGFFWGAMYVSYALTTGLMLVTCAVLVLGFNDPEFWVYVATITSLVLLTLPWVFRYSRVLMIYLFSPIRFNKNLVK